jgi:hypothetical protein
MPADNRPLRIFCSVKRMDDWTAVTGKMESHATSLSIQGRIMPTGAKEEREPKPPLIPLHTNVSDL